MKEYEGVGLTPKGLGARDRVRTCVREVLAKEFSLRGTEDEVDDFLVFCAGDTCMEFLYPMSLEESGWEEWVNVGIVEVH